MVEQIQVSIVMPSWNAELYISKAIESVLAQTFDSFELIIVDDASSDGTGDLLKEYSTKDPRIITSRLANNSGPAAARNKAIEIASGRYITFLDADDFWYPNKLATQLEFMRVNDIAFAYSCYDVVDETGKQTSTFVPPSQLRYRDLLKTCSIGCLTAIYDTNKLGKLYMPQVLKRQDFALWLKILRKVPLAYRAGDMPLAAYRKTNAGVSGNKITAAKFQWGIYRDTEKLSFLSSCYYFVHYMINGILKYR